MKTTFKYFEFLLPILFGIASFFLVVGPLALDPSNIGWLNGLDPAQHYLGWVFFRNSPWTFPIGLNPSFGAEISSSIVYSDSIPLLAFFFKLFAPWLPEPFQYIGIWVLLCFILQAWFSWKLSKLISKDLLVRLLICGLLGIFALPMLKRLGLHAALMGQFLVLAAIYLNLLNKNKYRLQCWLLLLVASSLINFYLLVMVFVLWLANLMDQWITNKNITGIELIKELIFCIIPLIFSMWQAGYFLSNPPSLGAEGFGVYKLNLLSLFDSNHWSYVVPNIKTPEDLGEGFNFLGLGILFLIPFAAIKVVPSYPYWMAQLKRHRFYCLVILGLTIFSLSNNISISNYSFHYYWPDFLINKAAILRSSGRLFWPVFYSICLFILVLIVNGYSRKRSLALLTFACLLQIFDSSAGWLPIRKHITNIAASNPKLELLDSFWHAAAKHYSKIEVYPLKASQTQTYWYQLSHLAAQFHLSTNAVYLGRSANVGVVNKENVKFEQIKLSGNYDVSTLYILDEWKNYPELLPPKVNPNKDLLALVNGIIILAPNWKICKDCPSVDPSLEIGSIAPPTK
jgi:hypothetical protein